MAAGLLPCLAQSAAHAHDAYDDEWHREQLAHIEQHVVLESLLHILGILYHKAEREDKRQTESEEEARACPLFVLLVEMPSHKEEKEVGDGLIELSGVAGHLVYALEDERPGHIGNLADYL